MTRETLNSFNNIRKTNFVHGILNSQGVATFWGTQEDSMTIAEWFQENGETATVTRCSHSLAPTEDFLIRFDHAAVRRMAESGPATRS